MQNAASFDVSMLPATIAVTAKAREKEQTFDVPVTWNVAGYNDSKTTLTLPGTLNFSEINELCGTKDVDASLVVTRLAAPVGVPFESRFADKTYDEAGLFDSGKDVSVK